MVQAGRQTTISFVTICVLFSSFRISQSERESKLQTSLRNSTANKNNQNEQMDNQNQDNALRSEAQKMLKQCGVERNESSNDDYNRYNQKGNKGYGANEYHGFNSGNHGKRNYYENQGSSGNNNYKVYGQGDDDGSHSDDGDWDTFGSQNWNANQNRGYSNKQASQYDNQNNRRGNGYGFGNGNQENPMYRMGNGFKSSSRGYQPSSTNTYNERSPFGSNRGYNRGGMSNECNDNRGYGDNGFPGYGGSNTFGYNNMPLGNNPQHRHRRYFNRNENDEEENTQCVSQCVFGYLQLLDEDRTPSETKLIKWLQDHATGNDMDRIKALREARRCFAKLISSDNEDGCDFSKGLSRCLDLDLE